MRIDTNANQNLKIMTEGKRIEWQNQQNKAAAELAFLREKQLNQQNWEQENAYNHPVQQMNRLRQAGLNPNLVYGKGADNTASSINSTTMNQPTQLAPNRQALEKTLAVAGQVSDGISKYYEINNTQAQTDNLYAQKALIEKEAILKDATTAQTVQSTAKTKQETEQGAKLMDNVVKASELNNIKTQAEIGKIGVDTKYTQHQDTRADQMNTAQLSKMLAEQANILAQTANTKQQTENAKQLLEIAKDEGKIKAAEAKLAEMNINKTDPWYLRALMKVLQFDYKYPRKY